MDIKQRNLQIISLRKNGLSVKDIAKTFDLSRTRIDQIIMQYEKKKKIEKNSKELIKKIKQADNIDKKWPMVDLIHSLKLSVRATTQMIKYFTGGDKSELSLHELIDAMALPDLEYEFSINYVPIFNQQQLGRIIYREIMRSLSAADFGDTFSALWKERKRVIHRRLGLLIMGKEKW
jgi:hypothetical protein